jgi:hypothetical protein
LRVTAAGSGGAEAGAVESLPGDVDVVGRPERALAASEAAAASASETVFFDVQPVRSRPAAMQVAIRPRWFTE